MGNDKKPHTIVTIMNRQVTALIDTGAQITVLGINHFEKLEELGNRLEPSSVVLSMADQ